MNGFRRDVERCGGFLDAESAEEAQLDDAALPFVDRGERLHGEVERDKIGRLLVRHRERVLQRLGDSTTAPLLIALRRATSTRMRRISLADIAKKCARSCQSTCITPDNRR